MSKKEMDLADELIGNQADIICNVDKGTTIFPPAAPDIVTMETPLTDSYAAELAFMEEMVTVTVHEAADENAINPIQVGCNGQFRMFWRGQPTKVQRKFANSLICKNTSVRTPEIQLGNGDRAFAIRQTSALAFPFIVEEDTPKGREWFKRRVAETL